MAFFFAPTSFLGQLNSFELIALPLFILMGNLLATPVGRLLFHAASLWLSWLRGGLVISTVGASAIFGAVSGVSVAGVAAIGSIAVPQMLEARLQPQPRRLPATSARPFRRTRSSDRVAAELGFLVSATSLCVNL